MFSTHGYKATCVRIYAFKTTRIKSSNELIVNTVFGNDLGRCVQLVKPVEDLNKHILVGRTLMKTSNTVPVRTLLLRQQR